MKNTEKKAAFFNKALELYGSVLSKNDAKEVAKTLGFKSVSWFLKPEYRLMRNQYQVPSDFSYSGHNYNVESGTVSQQTGPQMVAQIIPITKEIVVDEPVVPPVIEIPIEIVPVYIPEKDPNYVKFGFYKKFAKIIKSKMFYPIWIQGLSGNGKTMMVEQSCAELKRELFRINITSETDEDDLLGHYTLIDGQTVWEDGPVIKAMERGAILLLDEIDYATMKIACIQPVLEGKGVYLKKVNRWVKPVHGFNIISTANTKGKGSEDGRFIGTNIMNESFLERFPITVEQEYPSITIEKNIVNKFLNSLGCSDTDFATNLVNWSDIIRKTFYDGGVDEIIATRRLIHICQAYAIFGDRLQAIELCINRFDEETKTSFRDLYTKVDADVGEHDDNIEEDNVEPNEEDDLKPF